MKCLQVFLLVVLSLVTAMAEQGFIDPTLLEFDNSALSTRGNEFSIGFMGNYIPSIPRRGSSLLLVTTNEPEGANFTVEIPNLNISSFPLRLSVFPGNTEVVRLPYSDSLDIQVHSRADFDKGIHVVAEDNKLLSIVGFNEEIASSDAFLALPCHTYSSPNYDFFVFSTDFGATSTFTSRILMVPCSDNIEITVTGSQSLSFGLELDPTNQGTAPGTSSTLRRTHKLQTILLESPNDLTGTLITATGPISVFVGHECGRVPGVFTACDHMVEQIPPHITWGRLFLAVPLGFRQSGDRFKLGSIVDDNTVSITCTERNTDRNSTTVTVILNRGNSYQFDTIGINSLPENAQANYLRDYCCIQSSSPISVMQYTKGHSTDNQGRIGDPSMVLVTPVEQYYNNHLLPNSIPVNTAYTQNYISWAIASEFFDNSEQDMNNFLVDGEPLIPGFNENSDGDGYVPIRCRDNSICGYGAFNALSQQNHHVVEYTNEDRPNSAVNAIVYGFGSEVSYAYPAGFQMEPIGLAQITVFDEIVREGVGSVLLSLKRTGGEINLNSRVRASTRDRTNGGTTANDDYMPVTNHRVRWFPKEILPREGDRDPPLIIDIVDDEIPEVAEYFEVFFVIERNAYFFPNSVARITILDDDQPLLVSLPMIFQVYEDVLILEVLITTNDPRALMIQGSVLLYTQDKEAISGEDYEGIDISDPILLTFKEVKKGFEAETTIKILIHNDNMTEETETFEIKLMSNPNFPTIPNLLLNPGTATVHILDGQSGMQNTTVVPEVIQFQASTSTVNEGNTIDVKLVSSGVVLSEVSLTVTTLSDSATSPEDFTELITNVTFPIGTIEHTISVETITDSFRETTESFRLIIEAISNNLIIGNISEHTVHIMDSSPEVIVTFDRLIHTVSESSDRIEICLLSNGGNIEPIEVVLVSYESISPDEQLSAAEDGVDFSGSRQTIIFPSSLVLQKQCTNFTLFPNEITLENDKEFTVSIANITNGRMGVISEAKVVILDDDELIVTVEQSVYTVTEASTTVVICVNTNGGNAESFDVILVASESVEAGEFQMADDGADFDSSVEILSFPVSLVQQKQCTDFVLIPDDIALENDEEFQVFIANISKGGNIGEVSKAKVVILDDDELIVTVEQSVYTVTEVSTTVVICVNSSGGNAESFEVILVASESVEAGEFQMADDGADFDSSVETLLFPVSLVQQQQCTDFVLIPDDIALENDEEFEVFIANISKGGNIGEVSKAKVVILDDDELIVTVEQSVYTVTEASTTVVICVNTNGGNAESFEVILVASESVEAGEFQMADDGADFDSSVETLSFPVSLVQQQQCTDFVLIPDDIALENDEEFEVFIANISKGGNIGEVSKAKVVILDDDELIVIVEQSVYTVTEASTTVVICVNSSGGNAESFEVILVASESVEAGEFQMADDGADFDSSVETLSFPVSIVQQKQCTDFVLIPDDIALENDEEFQVFIANISKGGKVGEVSKAKVVILDDDELRITLERPLYTVPEVNTSVQICSLTNTGNAQPVAARLIVGMNNINASLRATDGVDFVGLHQEIRFMPDTEIQRFCVDITLIPDDVPLEFNEYISVILDLSSSMAEPGDITAAEIVIVDDDVLEVNFVNKEVAVNESVGELMICLNISSALNESIILPTLITGSPSDTNEFVFEPQQQVSCITIAIPDDTLVGNTREIIISVLTQDNIIVTSSMLVTIIDDDVDIITTDPLLSTCNISNPLMISPFNSSTSFTFKGTCELIVLSTCDENNAEYFRISVDFLTDTLENGAVGVFKNNFKWISREDGYFFTDYEGLKNNIDEETVHYVDSDITVQLINSSTKIVVSNGIDVTIRHMHGNPSAIVISTDGTVSQEFCGICKTNKDLLLLSNQSAIQTLVDSYRVLPRDQSLRPQRHECGIIRNDTVMGDPLFTVPLLTDSDNNENLCFEVHGKSNTIFNMISDICVNINALFSPMKIPTNGNIIGAIGIKAENDIGDCVEIKVELNECRVSINSDLGESVILDPRDKYFVEGISIRQYIDRVRVTVPNCEQVKLVLWMECERGEQDMIKFHVARGINLRPTSHGLLGQFWNIKIDHSLIAASSQFSFYNVTVFPQSKSSTRSFNALRYGVTWDKTKEYCLYAGNSQGGASNQLTDPDDSVIEGVYTDYIMKDLFDPNFKYSMWASCITDL